MRPLLFIFFFSLQAASLKRTDQRIFTAKPELLLSILTRFQETCENGCYYYLPNIIQRKSLEKQDPYQWIIWEKEREPLRTGTFFQVKLTYDGQTWTLKQTLLPSNEIKKLEQKTGLLHRTIFQKKSETWSLKQIKDSETKVIYHSHWQSNSPLMNQFFPILKGQITGRQKEMFNILEKI